MEKSFLKISLRHAVTNDLVPECCSAQVSPPLSASQFKLYETNFSGSLLFVGISERV